MAPGGYVEYAYGIRNTSDDILVDYTEVVITCRDDAGAIISSDKMTLGALYPGQVQYVSSLTGNGSAVPADVEFSINRPQDWWLSRAMGVPSTYEVSNASLVDDGLGGVKATGEVTVVSLGDDQELSSGSIALTAIIRDGSGAIIASGQGYVTTPPEGESTTFEVPFFSDVTSGSLEVYANTW